MEKDHSQVNPLEHFNSGGVVIVEITKGITVLLQKIGTKVRAAVIGASGERNMDEFNRLVADLGGNTAIMRTALDSIGFTQELEKGSGVLQKVGHKADAVTVLSNFKWDERT